MGAMSWASSLRTLGEIPSGPVALLGLMLVCSFSTPWSVIVKLSCWIAVCAVLHRALPLELRNCEVLPAAEGSVELSIELLRVLLWVSDESALGL